VHADAPAVGAKKPVAHALHWEDPRAADVPAGQTAQTVFVVAVHAPPAAGALPAAHGVQAAQVPVPAVAA